MTFEEVPKGQVASLRTHSGRGALLEGVITKPLQEGGLSYAGVPHQDDLEEAVRWRGTSFFLRKQALREEGLKRDYGFHLAQLVNWLNPLCVNHNNMSARNPKLLCISTPLLREVDLY